jgi:hypothetical protein
VEPIFLRVVTVCFSVLTHIREQDADLSIHVRLIVVKQLFYRDEWTRYSQQFDTLSEMQIVSRSHGMTNSKIVTRMLWWGFFVYYSIYKYVVSLQVWDPDFAVQVAFLSLMTAFVPYYLARFGLNTVEGLHRVIGMLILPLTLCALGYAVFYYTRIVPYFDGVSLLNDVLPRSIFPGIMLTGIFFVEWFLRRREPAR